MELNVKKVGEITVLILIGRFDASAAPMVEERLQGLIESGTTKMVIDLKGVDYLSSGGLRVLLVAQKSMHEKGNDLKLASLQPYVKEVFGIAGFDKLFKTFENQEEAIKDFS